LPAIQPTPCSLYHTILRHPPSKLSYLFFFNDTTTTEIYTLSLHDALPISNSSRTSEAALWPSTYISPLSNSTPCIRKDRISSKSLMRLSICLWKPSIGD